MSAAAIMRPEDYQRRHDMLAGWPVRIVSYRLGGRFRCEIDNVDPGSVVARGEGASREQAEAAAGATAARRLARTRVHAAAEG